MLVLSCDVYSFTRNSVSDEIIEYDGVHCNIYRIARDYNFTTDINPLFCLYMYNNVIYF